MLDVLLTFFLKHALNVHPVFHISLMSFCEAQCGLVVRVLRQLVWY